MPILYALHSEIAKLQSAHDIALHQLENARIELIEVKSVPCEKCLVSSKLVASNVESSSCSVCLEREREVHDVVEELELNMPSLRTALILLVLRVKLLSLKLFFIRRGLMLKLVSHVLTLKVKLLTLMKH